MEPQYLKKCGGCLQNITDRQYLTCSICQLNYELECANVSIQRFYNTMTKEHKRNWICDACRSRMPKRNNTNTPVRQLDTVSINAKKTVKNTVCSPSISNITLRERHRNAEINTSCSDEDDQSILGDTFAQESNINAARTVTIAALDSDMDTSIRNSEIPGNDGNIITPKEFNRLLQENNKLIISQLRSTFQAQIETAITALKDEFKKNTEYSKNQQIKTSQELEKINDKIRHLYSQCSSLKAENEKLKTDLQNLISQHSNESKSFNNHDKDIVLHEMICNYWESEHDVIQRITNIFYDIQHIDLYKEIDDISYIGKNALKRPIKIELSNKRLKRYILENAACFYQTGLKVSEFLDESTLRTRRELKRAQQAARTNGHHAIIKNNKLFINGQEMNSSMMNSSISVTNEPINHSKKENIPSRQPFRTSSFRY